ncbi:MAG: tRNA (adenosine(37)-N6)-threonylcarbamoyltransferase complex dimerization subunit type 1 TsaB [Bacteroidales bacterium]|jgi:tRNA threonylcarbamoyladenosine biosynthesis protein TsaB|nr:tRNA (adenosine(37)-N6)-threonylcarbamoyltransferase complex dimerization subunit type 1 TsaB [Bacteroidales bacterium]MDD3272602.1 tRNA (adenosine(37)-N6)-threonylcarbamoyltransferase complex dimerization subunit type 1 TsaB [Bacteroidales bacterium]MDD4057413.1 tRNA (adenosine(37)-N6)-threonylcarbamoyltransferase complex dimerization subunit type 1 TsaB [Bacteroidales bacterium]
MRKSNSICLLLIETSTEVCSVALGIDGIIVSQREIKEHKAHARVIPGFIQEVLNEASVEIKNCSAVVVSEGPGSYTGLRVGVSVAKGICYGANIPLIAVGSLELIARLSLENCSTPEAPYRIVPMIDARRMEVYTAIFDENYKQLTKTEAHILTGDSFAEILSAGKVVFTGDGADKFKSVIDHPNAIFVDGYASARGMILPAMDKYKRSEFADVAYFEPFYLKDFIAGVSKRSLL